MKTQLTLANMRELDFGKIDVAFRHELKRIVDDMVERPGDDRPREIGIRFSFTPDGESGVCQTCRMEVEMKSKVPSVRTKPYELGVNAGGGLVFNPASPDDIKQGTLDEA